MIAPEKKRARSWITALTEPRRSNFSHDAIDRRNAARDRLVANRLRHDQRILRQARANLERWMARDGQRVRPVFAEWRRILEYLKSSEIADFLISDTPMVRRLRQSSPFMGPLPGRTRI